MQKKYNYKSTTTKKTAKCQITREGTTFEKNNFVTIK